MYVASGYLAGAISPVEALLAGDESAVASVRGHGQWLAGCGQVGDVGTEAGELLLEATHPGTPSWARAGVLSGALDRLRMVTR